MRGELSVEMLAVTPIKGFALQHPHEVLVTTHGVSGDREFVLVDETRRVLSVTRSGAFATVDVIWDEEQEVLTMSGENAIEALSGPVVAGRPISVRLWNRDAAGTVVEGPWSRVLSDWAGRFVELVRFSEPGAGIDAYPVTLLGRESVEAVASAGDGRPIDMRRFRMLVNFAGGEPYLEDSWCGRRIIIGETELEIVGPVARCAATTRCPSSGKRDLDTLRFIRRARGTGERRSIDLGVYASVRRAGRIRLGDPIET